MKNKKIFLPFILTFTLIICIFSTALFVQASSDREDILNKDELLDIMEPMDFTSSDGTVLPYRIYIPDDYEGDSATHPLVISLHGSGCRGNDNESQFLNTSICNRILTKENREKYKPIVIAPQCAENYRWVETDWTQGSYTLTDDLPSVYLKATEELITQLCSEYRIDNVYSTGVSMGSYGSWALILRNPQLYTAAINVCGAGDPEQAYKLKDVRVRAFHGSVDDTVPVQGSRDMVKAMKESNCNDVNYTEYGGLSHNIWYKAFTDQDVIDWLFSEEPNKTSYWDGETNDIYYDGNGTKDDPYIVSSAEELAGIEYNVQVLNNNFQDKYFKQTRDIDLQSNAINDISSDFKGEYDTNGYDISNVYIPVEEIVIDENNVNLHTNETYKIDTRIIPDKSTNKALNYTCDDENVATVSQDGIITAKAEGQTLITVTSLDTGVTNQINLTVDTNADENQIKNDNTDKTSIGTNYKTGDNGNYVNFILAIILVLSFNIVIIYRKRQTTID